MALLTPYHLKITNYLKTLDRRFHIWKVRPTAPNVICESLSPV